MGACGSTKSKKIKIEPRNSKISLPESKKANEDIEKKTKEKETEPPIIPPITNGISKLSDDEISPDPKVVENIKETAKIDNKEERSIIANQDTLEDNKNKEPTLSQTKEKIIINDLSNLKEQESNKKDKDKSVKIKEEEMDKSHNKTKLSINISKAKNLEKELSRKSTKKSEIKMSQSNYNHINDINDNDSFVDLINADNENPDNQEINLFHFKKSLIPKPLFFVSEISITTNIDFSDNSEYSALLKKIKILSHVGLVYKILLIKERLWMQENIEITDKLKNINFMVLNKYINQKTKLQEHFNWLVWAVAELFFSCYIINRNYEFNNHPTLESKIKNCTLFELRDNEMNFTQSLEDFGLPNAESTEWMKGFEWKGVYFQLITLNDYNTSYSKEVESMKYTYFEYLQILENANKNSNITSNLPKLLSDLIFPIFSTVKTSNLVLIASALVNVSKQSKYTYSNLLKPNLNDFNLHMNSTNQDIDLNETFNIIDKYDITDFKESSILNQLGDENLVRVFAGKKTKNLLINAYSLIPTLISAEENFSFIYVPTNIDKSMTFFNIEDLDNIKSDYSSNEDILSSIISNKRDKKKAHENTKKAKKKKKELFSIIETLLFQSRNEIQNKNKSMNNYETNHPFNIWIKVLYKKTNMEMDINNSHSININTIELNEVKNNSRIEDYLINYNHQHITPNLKYYEIENPLFESSKQKLLESQTLEINGDSIVIFKLSSDIKMKYSIINQHSLNRVININKLLDNFSQVLNHLEAFNITINNTKSLNNLFERYAINDCFDIFFLNSIKDSNLADILKIRLVISLLGQVFSIHEGVNFEIKYYLNNEKNIINHEFKTHDAILLHDYFYFIKEKSIFNSFRNKLYYTILILLSKNQELSHLRKIKSFNNNINNVNDFLYKHLSYLMLSKQLNALIINEKLKIHLINDNFSFDNLLEDCISACQRKPFVFITAVEEEFKIKINEYTKFKISVSIESFLDSFNELDIKPNDLVVESFLSPSEIGYYLLTKCMNANNEHKQLKDNIENPEYLETASISLKKKNMVPKFIQGNKLASNYNDNDSRTNMHSTTNKFPPSIRQMNSENHKMKIDTEDSNAYNINKEYKKKKTWEVLFSRYELFLPPILYKINCTPLALQGNQVINQNLLHSYSISSFEIANDWKILLEHLYSNINTLNGDEDPLIQVYFIIFINYFFIEEDNKQAKDILYKLKSLVKNNFNRIKVEYLSIISFFEGLLIERKNYIDSEKLFSQSLILSLLIYGDPRGKGNLSNYMIGPIIWKIARQTTILENFLITENFKEMFHCNDFFNKQNTVFNSLMSNSNYNKLYSKPKINQNYKENYCLYDIEITNRLLINTEKNVPLTARGRNMSILQNSGLDYMDGIDEETSFDFLKENIKNEMFISSYNFIPQFIHHDLSQEEENNFNQKLMIKDIKSKTNLDIFENKLAREIYTNRQIYEISNNCSFMSSLFNFPPISDYKAHSLNTDKFTTIEFILYLLKYFINCNNSHSSIVSLDKIEDILGFDVFNANLTQTYSVKSGKTLNSIGSAKQVPPSKQVPKTMSHFSLPKNTSKVVFDIKNKDVTMSTLQFSLLYDILLFKLNFKKYISDGVVMSFGNNSNNETSHSGYECLSLPRIVYKLKDEKIISINAGWGHNCVISNEHKLFVWGNNENGQCGASHDKIIHNPTEIQTISNILNVSCGDEHTICTLVNEFNMKNTTSSNSKPKIKGYSWGKAEGGVLGYIKEAIEYFPKEIPQFPSQDDTINTESINRLVYVSCGSLHNVALTEEYTVARSNNKINENYKTSKLYTWGFGEGGQLGLAEKYLTINAKQGFLINPTEINIASILKTNIDYSSNINKNISVKITKVSCGEAHCILLTSTNEVWGWGFSNNGQLGLGFCADSFETGMGNFSSRVFTPKKINFPQVQVSKTLTKTINIIDIEAGKTFSTFISDKYHLYVCGVNDLHQLGIETPEDNTKHVFNQYDTFNNKCNDIVTPTLVECFYNMKVKKIACGEGHCLAIIEDESGTIQTIWSWGSNIFGQLGLGQNISKSLPKPINYLLNFSEDCWFSDINCGAYHSLILLKNKNLKSNADTFSYNYNYNQKMQDLDLLVNKSEWVSYNNNIILF